MKHFYQNPESILITGATSGLGYALALAYARENRTLFLWGRQEDKLLKIKKECQKKGATVYTFCFDITDTQQASDIVAEIEKIKPVDLVIANAGVSKAKLGKHWQEATRNIFQTNVMGTVGTVLPVLSYMKKRNRGQIALISSMAGFRGMSSCPAYSASKVCLKAWGEALRGSLKAKGIGVTVVCPGFIKTPLTDANTFKMPMIWSAEKAAGVIKKRLEKNPCLIAFPWPFLIAACLGSLLPASLFLWFSQILPKKEK